MWYWRSAVGLVVAVAALSGCISSEDPFETTSRPTASSTALQDRDDLLAALRKTHASRYTFSVQANLGADGNVAATGAVDAAAQVFSSTVKVTDTKLPSTMEHLVVNQQMYVRSADDKSKRWMHVDLTKLSKDSSGYVDVADPAGLARFIDSVGSVERGSTAGAYLGKFNANKASPLPIGAPLETCLCSFPMAFRALVDAQGRVTSIVMDVVQSSGPTLKMTTTMAGFDQPVTVTAPAAASTFEAPDWYYKTPTPSPSK